MTPAEESALMERIQSHASAEPSGSSNSSAPNQGKQSASTKPYVPHFICECYFMTLKGLHMGYIGVSKAAETLQRVLLSPSTQQRLPRPKFTSPTTFPLILARVRIQHAAVSHTDCSLSVLFFSEDTDTLE